MNGERSFSGLSFLVVDDDPEISLTIQRLLRSRGAKQVWRELGVKQAMASVPTPETAPDVIISDCRMSPLSGLHFLQAVRMGLNKNLPRDTPFIMLTGYSEMGTVSAARALDVSGFVMKPASIQTVINAIQKAMSIKPSLRTPEDYQRVPLPSVGNAPRLTSPAA